MAERAAPTRPAKAKAPPPRLSALPDDPGSAPPVRRPAEPVWLVRVVVLLFLVGFAMFLGREVGNFLDSF